MRQLHRLYLLPVLGLMAMPVEAQPVTLDDWFRGPRVEQVSLSPDARYLSMVVRDGDNVYVAVKDRTAKEPAHPVLASNNAQDVEPRFCGWVGPKRLVCRLTGLTSNKGEGQWVGRYVAVDADGSNQRVLLKAMAGFSPGRSAGLGDQLRITSWRADEVDSFLVSGYFPGSGIAVGKVNAVSGSLKLIVRQTDPLTAFQDDGHGNVLFAGGVPRTITLDHKVRYFGRSRNEDDWKPLTRLKAHENDPIARLGSVEAGTGMAYAVLGHQGRAALFKVDLTDKKDPELTYWHEQRDVGSVVTDSRGRMLGVAFETHGIGPQYLDSKVAALDTALRKQWPDRWNWIQDSSDDGKTFVVKTEGLSEPNGYYVLDTSQGGVRFDFVGAEYPGFLERQMPRTEFVGIKTRTGKLIEALFTPAANGDPKAPLVVFADGTQTVGAFEPASYFLATRGYAVLRPYFTGKQTDTDWGKAPYLAWNGELFDEIMDATAWAAQRPDVDGARACIVGRNAFGGYTALLAAARADSRFVCAASLSGLSDLYKPRRDATNASRIENEKPTGTSDEAVKAESPLARAGEFRIPVFLSEDDTRTHGVSANEGGREMAAALAAANKPHQLLLINDVDDAYLRTLYLELDKFLAKHLR